MTGKKKGAAMKWSDLGVSHVGRTVRLTFPWDTTPVTATVREVGGAMGFARDPGWIPPEDQPEDAEPATAPLVPSFRHTLDYGGEVGRQETQLAGVLSVELLP